MDNKIRVSAIMTCYNGERFVSEQVNSILNALGPNDELIVSDDGSKDNSMNILKSIQENDSRLVILNGPKKGLNANINFLDTSVSTCGKNSKVNDEYDNR